MLNDPREPQPSLEGPVQPLVGALTIALFLTPVAAYFWLVQHFGINAIWYDQWDDVNLIAHPSLSTLWMQHNENRIFVPNLIVLLLAHTTGFNVHLEEYLSACLLVTALALLILSHRRRSPTTPYLFYLPVAILMLSFVQWWNALFGFQLAWYIDMVCLAAAVYFLDRLSFAWWAFLAAAVISLIGSLSSLQGLFIWVVGLYLLYARRRSWRHLVIWTACAVTTWLLYFYDFSSTTAGSNDSVAWHQLSKTVTFTMLEIGDLVGTSIPFSGHDPPVLGAGVVLVLVALAMLGLHGCRREETSRPIGIAMIIFGLIFAFVVAVGRAQYGLYYAASSRYTTFVMLVLVGCYFILIDGAELTQGSKIKDQGSSASPKGTGASSRNVIVVPRWQRAVHLGLLVVVGLMIVAVTALGTKNGYSQALTWNTKMSDASRVMVNIDRAPDNVVTSVLYPSPASQASFVRKLDHFARARHLSVFATPAAELEAREGLPMESGIETQLFSPAPGSRVRGTVLLIASGYFDIGPIRTPAGKVEFAINGPGGTVTVPPAVFTFYGWITKWDTTKDPNGAYRIRSVAYNSTGKAAASPTATFRIDNS